MLPMLTQQGFPPCTPTSVARLTALTPRPKGSEGWDDSPPLRCSVSAPSPSRVEMNGLRPPLTPFRLIWGFGHLQICIGLKGQPTHPIQFLGEAQGCGGGSHRRTYILPQPSGAVLGGIIGRRKRGVSALADTVPFFGIAENTPKTRQSTPCPVGVRA